MGAQLFGGGRPLGEREAAGLKLGGSLGGDMPRPLTLTATLQACPSPTAPSGTLSDARL